MPLKPLEWSKRSLADTDSIFIFHAEVASLPAASHVRAAIAQAARVLQENPLAFRPGRSGTREFVMQRYPFTLVYRVYAGKIRIVRVLHQARDYFN